MLAIDTVVAIVFVLYSLCSIEFWQASRDNTRGFPICVRIRAVSIESILVLIGQVQAWHVGWIVRLIDRLGVGFSGRKLIRIPDPTTHQKSMGLTSIGYRDMIRLLKNSWEGFTEFRCRLIGSSLLTLPSFFCLVLFRHAKVIMVEQVGHLVLSFLGNHSVLSIVAIDHQV